MGSAALYHLARRGYRVLGLERFDIPNQMGSSHGITRIIRLAYYEHHAYVPLLLRAYELWRKLQRDFGEKLLHITGSIDAGPEGSHVFEGSKKSCELNNLDHSIMDSKELSAKFPGYQLPPKTLAVYQPEGGFLLSERCIVAHVTNAQKHSAEIKGRECVQMWEPRADGVKVHTDRGVYQAKKLAITTGAWTSKLIPSLGQVLTPERQVLAWLQPRKPNAFNPEKFPVFNLTVDEGRFYGFPVFHVPGFKFGRYHHLEETVDPDTVNRGCSLQDEAVLRKFAERYFPDGAGPTMGLKTCMFTNTKDRDFIIDSHPEYPQVTFAGGFSGHGFKFCSVVGEILADLVEKGRTGHHIDQFKANRPSLHKP